MFGSSTLQGVCSLFHFAFGVSLSFGLRLVLVFCSGVSFLAPVSFFWSFVASSAHFVLLFGRLLLASVAVCLSLHLLALCICSFSRLFAFALSPLLLALFCCLRSGVSDIGFLAFASTHGSVGVLWWLCLSWDSRRWVMRFCGLATGFPFLLPPRLSNVPILLPSFSPSSFRGFALSTAVACLHAIGALAPFSSFRSCLLLLLWLSLPFSSYLSSFFCRALLLFFPCSFITFLGFSVLVLGWSLPSSVTLRFSFLLLVVSGRLT